MNRLYYDVDGLEGVDKKDDDDEDDECLCFDWDDVDDETDLFLFLSFDLLYFLLMVPLLLLPFNTTSWNIFGIIPPFLEIGLWNPLIDPDLYLIPFILC